MGQRVKQSEKELAEKVAQNQELLEKINRTSNNSSSPPSTDPLSFEKPAKKNKSGKKRGGQPGHKGHSRFLYEPEDCEEVLNHHPEMCKCCGEKLIGVDRNPYRHQVVEIPPINPIIVEHRLHQVECQHCGILTRATLPVDGNNSHRRFIRQPSFTAHHSGKHPVVFIGCVAKTLISRC